MEATDKAGNKTTQQLDFIIDTLLSEPTIVLDNTDDSGTKGDNLTNVNKPTFYWAILTQTRGMSRLRCSMAARKKC
ncbi:hypothetical protein DBK37_08700 [Salmonella enterica subsp. enterica serovar Typhi]|nr:hypothetical protein DBK37_08700 [Salmonella enterica subsp. enterica serovar Typhi]